MALSTYALVSVEELRRALSLGGDEKTALLEEIIHRASDLVEQYLEREIVTRGAVTEYHNPTGLHDVATLWLRNYPIDTITSVHEDTGWPRTYGDSYLLVAGTDYASASPNLLRRMDSGGLRAWAPGFRTVKVVYSYGYENTDAVPDRIKKPTIDLCALMWAEATRGQHGISGASDSIGNWTRFSAAQLTQAMKDELINEKRMVFESTAEFA
jgi:hypothetical protein